MQWHNKTTTHHKRCLMLLAVMGKMFVHFFKTRLLESGGKYRI
jgi:anti-sigma factor ChrR (cupin superfamily)